MLKAQATLHMLGWTLGREAIPLAGTVRLSDVPFIGHCAAQGLCARLMLVNPAQQEIKNMVSDLPCNIRRERGQSLVIGGSSLVILQGKACNPL